MMGGYAHPLSFIRHKWKGQLSRALEFFHHTHDTAPGI